VRSFAPAFLQEKQDIAVRNCINIFMKTPLLQKNKIRQPFGDASYYKNRTVNNTNIVPIYHALNSSTTGEVSFASDDFTD
jgi:hypothetical protein